MTYKKLAILHDCITTSACTCKKNDSLLERRNKSTLLKFLACPASTLTLYIVVCMNIRIISFKDKLMTY